MFCASPQRAREIGESLHARYLLEGSTRQEGARIRIIARLVVAATEVHAWSDVYERTTADMLSVQAEVAGHIAHAITRQITSPSQHGKESVLCDYVLRSSTVKIVGPL